MIKIVTYNEQETREFGEKLAKLLISGNVVAFVGDLATGKTTLIKGICKGLGINRDVDSPTYTLINEYSGTPAVYHMECYREHNIGGWLEIGINDYLYGDGISLVEWADQIEELLPKDTIKINLEHEMSDINCRFINISASDNFLEKVKEITNK